MAEIPDVVRVGGLAFDVELSRVPVAALSRRLRSEVNPDSELRFAQPSRIGGWILRLDRIPGGLEWSRGDGKIHLHFGKLRRVAHGDRAQCLGCRDIWNRGQGRELEAAIVVHPTRASTPCAGVAWSAPVACLRRTCGTART